MKVPVLEQQVEVKPTAQSPVLSNTPAISNPLEAAFGGAQTAAQAKFGAAGADLSDTLAKHMIQRDHQEQEQQVLDADTKFRQDVQNHLYSQEPDDNGVPKGFLLRPLAAAKGATVQFDSTYKDLRDSYLGTVQTPAQKALLAKLMDSHFQTAREEVIKHEANQGNQDYKDSIEANLKQRTQDAAAISDPAALKAQIMQGQAIMGGASKRLGFDDATATVHAGGVAADIAKSSILATLEKNPKQAQALLDSIKDRLPASAVADLQKTVDGKLFYDKSLAVWDQVKGARYADGMPDTAKMEQKVRALPDSEFTAQDKEKLWDYVKSRANESAQQLNQVHAAADRDFFNKLFTGKSQGMTLDDATKLATASGYDAYDQGQKVEAVKQLYSKPTETDPRTYMVLWEGVQDGRANKADIDTAMNRGLISTADWTGLRKEYYNSQIEGKSPEAKATWERIKLLSEEKFGKNDGDNGVKRRDAFMYEMHRAGIGKTPEEIWKMAQDKLKDVSPGHWWNSTQYSYKKDSAEADARNLAFGTLYEQFGKEPIDAIGAGTLKPNWGIKDIDTFANQFGGYDALKPDQPAGLAIQYLTKNSQRVTVANVKAVIHHFGLDAQEKK